MKRVRSWIILAVAGALVYAGLSHAYVTPILMYHHIDRRDQVWKLSVSPESFYKQMEFLRAHGYHVLPLEEYVSLLVEDRPVPRKSVVITFDDGYLNNATDAFPVLKEMGFPATIFIQVDHIGQDGYMTEEDLAILSENGIEIGSHTLHHGFLPDLDEEAVRKEVFNSKRRLETLLSKPVRLFSYPGGGFDPKIREWVQKAGYSGAVATHPGPLYPDRDPFALKRVRISRTSDNLFVFWLKISGYYTYIEEFRG